MNAQEIIEYIRTSEKKTPVKVYVWEKEPVEFPGCQVFPAADGCKIVFGDWKVSAPILQANTFAHLEIENNCRNSAIPMLDLKDIPARIEPGAVIREQVEIGKNAVIMMTWAPFWAAVPLWAKTAMWVPVRFWPVSLSRHLPRR